MNITVTYDEFIVSFPEFGNTVTYPATSFTLWASVAEVLLPAWVWGRMLNLGAQLFIAHQLVLEAQAQKAAAMGGIPGTQIGVLTAKQVDKASASYSAEGVIDLKAGHWNMTTFGLRFIQLANMFGARPIQVGAGGGGAGVAWGTGGGYVASPSAWAGPWPWNFPNMNM